MKGFDPREDGYMLTLQEIKEQYRSMEKTEEYLSKCIDSVQAVFAKSPKGVVVFLGCGSSYSIAKSCAQSTMTGLNRVALAMAAGDVMIHADRYQAIFEDAIIVVISRSGETTEIVRAVEKIRQNSKVQVISLSCKKNMPTSKLADVALEMPWAFDNSVCQTRTVSCFYFAWLYLVGRLSGNQQQLADLQVVIEKGDAFLTRWEEKLKEMAMLAWDHVVVLGDAEISGICEEGSLAFKEICQLPGNFHHMLDLRHGPMVLVGKDTLVLMPLSNHSLKLQLSLLEDVKKKGATVIAYSNTPMELDGACNIYFDHELTYPVMGLPFLLINQLVAYHKSIERGTNPDQPEGLAPWIAI